MHTIRKIIKCTRRLDYVDLRPRRWFDQVAVQYPKENPSISSH